MCTKVELTNSDLINSIHNRMKSKVQLTLTCTLVKNKDYVGPDNSTQ